MSAVIISREGPLAITEERGDGRTYVLPGENTLAAAGYAAQAAAQLAIVTAAGAAQVALASDEADRAEEERALAQQAAADAVDAVTDVAATGGLSILFQSVGAINLATLTNNRGVHQFALINGTHIQTGQTVHELSWSWAAASDTDYVRVRIYKRDVAAATTASTLNSAGPVAQDTLVADFNTTLAALGVTAGTTNAVLTSPIPLPTPILIEAGFDYLFDFRNFNAADALVNCGYLRGAFGTAAQRRAGFFANTATPTSFSNNTTTNTPPITLYTKEAATQLGAEDLRLRELVVGRGVETLETMNARNTDNLYSALAMFPLTLSGEMSLWGDSQVDDDQAATEYRLGSIVQSLVTGTVNERGNGGNTSAVILGRIEAAPSAEKSGINFIMAGANDVGSLDPSVTLANIASSVAVFGSSNYIVCSAWVGGTLAAGSLTQRRIHDIREGLRTTYDERFFDSQAAWARLPAGTTDQTISRLGGAPPATFRADSLHKNSRGGLAHGQMWGALGIAAAGHAPFVHDDTMAIRASDEAGDVIGTVRALGNMIRFKILAGNEDGAVQINPATGQILRTAAALRMPYRELFVSAENRFGEGRNGRIIIVQRSDNTRPIDIVRVNGAGGGNLTLRTDGVITNGQEITIVACLRQTETSGSGHIITGLNNLASSNGRTMRLTVQDTLGATCVDVTATPESPGLFNFYAFAANTATGVEQARVNLDAVAAGTTANSNSLNLSALTTLFNNSAGALPWIGDLMMLAVYDEYHDISDNAVIANWWDNAARLPKDIGNGTAGGAFSQPVHYLRGMAGDYLMGQNIGTAGAFHVPVPIGPGLVGFEDKAL